MARIHHNTVKKAASHGLQIIEGNDGEFYVCSALAATIEKALAVAKDPKDALDLAILDLNPPKAKKPRRVADEDEGDEDMTDDEVLAEAEEDEEASRSIVKDKYKEKYRPHKMTCGDTIAQKVRAAFMTKSDPDTKKPRLDFEAFVRFAKANDCWVEGYRSLKDRHGNRNNGMIRMNVCNRLRAKVAAGHKIVW